MSARGSGPRRGPRFTAPRSRVVDRRQPEQFDPGTLAQLRAQGAAQCLDLGGAEQLPPPPALAQLTYAADAPELTGFAGLPALMKFAYSVGLADRLAGLPLPRKRPQRYPGGKLGEVVVALLAAGLSRVSHVDYVTHDPGLTTALGLERLPDQATLSRFFSAAGAAAVEFGRQVNRAFSRQSVRLPRRPARLVVDADTRVVGVYGKQEGAVRSPRNGGDPQFTFELCTLRDTYDILDGGLLPGVSHPAPLFAARFAALQEQLGGRAQELILCADAAWYAGHILRTIEAADEDRQVAGRYRYAIRAQIRGALRRALAALPESAWRPCAEGCELAEVRVAMREARGPRDHRERRHIVTRTRQPEPATAQVELFPHPRYGYGVIVTNLEWKARAVWSFYNQRATIESVLKEGALGFHMDSLPSARFAGNALFCQLLILAYNVVNQFRRWCLPAEHRQRQVPGLRRLLLAVPGRLEQLAERLVIHVAPQTPAAELLPGVLQALQHWLGGARAPWPAAAG